jgi:hypothetical protein
MATLVSKTVGTGGDYPDLAAWFAAAPASLITADQIWQARLLNQVFSTTTTLLNITGKATNATHYFEITADAGCSFLDAPNLRTSGPLRYNGAFGARIEESGTSGYCPLVISTAYTRISKIQFATTANYPAGARALLNMGDADGNNFDVNQCLFEGDSNYGAWGGGVVSIRGANSAIRNSVMVLRSLSVDAVIAAVSWGAVVRNCTLVSLNVKVSAAIYGDSGAATIKNSYVGNATSLFSGSSTWTATNCLSDASTLPSGFSSAPFSTTTFENITDGTLDLRPKDGSALINAGASYTGAYPDTTAWPTTDISGYARSGSWDVGAWETVSAAVSATASGATLTSTSTLAPGTATGSGPVSASAPGATLTGTSTLSVGTASGPAAAGTITTDPLENNVGSLWLGQSVHWTWTQGGRIGSMTGKTLVEGTGTTHATTGALTVSGLPAGAGCLQIAVRGATPADDAVYHATGTVT